MKLLQSVEIVTRRYPVHPVCKGAKAALEIVLVDILSESRSLHSYHVRSLMLAYLFQVNEIASEMSDMIIKI